MFDCSQLVYKQQTPFGVIYQNILQTTNQGSFVASMDGNNTILTLPNIISIISLPLIEIN